uniref:hypothetical protein n=1 Tax=Caballeronia sp. AAUFL_F2_KS46 TaxID=2921780 RepID=UPI002028DCFF
VLTYPLLSLAPIKGKRRKLWTLPDLYGLVMEMVFNFLFIFSTTLELRMDLIIAFISSRPLQ